MKLLGILGTAVDTEYVHFDVTLTCLIASLRASQRGWLWVFWVAIAFFTLYFPVFVPYFAPNVWQRIDVASAILMLVGAYAWLIVGWRERRKAQTAS